MLFDANTNNPALKKGLILQTLKLKLSKTPQRLK